MDASWPEVADPELEAKYQQFKSLESKSNWEKISEDQNTQMFRLRGAHDYDIFKTVIMVPKPAGTVFNFLNSTENFERWGTNLKSCQLKSQQQNLKLMYIQQKMTTPLDDREMYVCEKAFERDGNYYVVGTSFEAEDIPVVDGHVRASIFMNTFQVQPMEDNSCLVTYLVDCDFAGNLPKFGKEKVEKSMAKKVPRIFSGIS